MRARTLLVAAAAALVHCAAALAESPVLRTNPADQAAAKAAVLKAADVGAGWKGGARKADIQFESPCPETWNPKQADLTITGAAESEFTHAGGETISTSAQVYETAAMLEADWARTVVAPAAIACLRKSFAGAAQGVKLVSFQRLAFAKVAPRTIRFRAVLDYATSGKSVRMMLDLVAFGKGRTAVTLTLIAPYAERADATGAETRLAKILASRFAA